MDIIHGTPLDVVRALFLSPNWLNGTNEQRHLQRTNDV
jgi:hypothetical protein